MQIDLLTYHFEDKLAKELLAMGVGLIAISSLRHPFKQYRQIRALIRQNNYGITYFNISTAVNCIASLAAKHAGVSTKILHSHSSGCDGEHFLYRTFLKAMHYFSRTWFYTTANRHVACSKMAGQWMFPKHITESSDFVIIPNAVDVTHFAFDPQLRNIMRSQLAIDSNVCVVGFVGNFCYAKNLPFLVDIFADICREHTDFMLLMAGDGPEKDDIRYRLEKRGILDKARLLGYRDDIPALMQAMDVFVVPSRFEGLSIVTIEAQASGLPCVISDKVPIEVVVADTCNLIPLASSRKCWVEAVVRARSQKRANNVDQLRKVGYGAGENWIKDFILKLISESGRG